MNVKETLMAARALIADESGWTQHAWARNSAGNSLSSSRLAENAEAVSFCAMGALLKVDGPNEDKAMILLNEVSLRLFNIGSISVNDIMGHEAILRVFDEAILEAEGSQS